MSRQPRLEEYTVAWVCALPIEHAAALAMLDTQHGSLTPEPGEKDIYSLGSMAGHNVVIACLPCRTGTNTAAALATRMQSKFEGIRFRLLVGIGGGVPRDGYDIRLGDVVVSTPCHTYGGVVQYDMIKRTHTEAIRIGSLDSPPSMLLSAVNLLRTYALLGKSKLLSILSEVENVPCFQRSERYADVLYEADYPHKAGLDCRDCSIDQQKSRSQRRKGEEVVVHYGTIASGNQVMKSAADRDRISQELGGVLCFEMEAAGLMNDFRCIVIRGISDYADSHKNDHWQGYAASTAAAYAKELLLEISPAQVIGAPKATEAFGYTGKRSVQSPEANCAPSKRRKIEKASSTELQSEREMSVVLQDRTRRSVGEDETDQPQERYLSRRSLSEEQKQQLLKSLKFEEIDERKNRINRAHARTCKWLLKTTGYIEWLDATKIHDHHGFLWIKGKAGAGKSTLMKFALEKACKEMKDSFVISFFFNARGSKLEKSTIGVYRSLLLKLLIEFPALQDVFETLYAPMSNSDTSHDWSVESLKTLLEEAIQKLEDISVVCFIDALDECDETEIRDMIQFFEHIGDLSVERGIRFLICLSSRHYPHITIRNGLELVLEGQEGHNQDITNYIETELKIGKSKKAQQIRIAVQDKAVGVFMWVVLVVGILNKESDWGRVHRLQQKLHEISGDLHDLFRDILTRDSNNKEELVLCIQWVLFAKEPLSPQQLYYAILSGVDPDAVSAWDPETIDQETIKRFIIDCSKGLTDVTASRHQKVQFIHESVRDFLLKEEGLSKIWPEYKDNFLGRSHERLKQCCSAYLQIDLAESLDISEPLPTASSHNAKELRLKAEKQFPLLRYAVKNIFYHSDRAEDCGIPQAQFLIDFQQKSGLWIRLCNMFQKFESRKYRGKVSLLYVLVKLNCARLIESHLPPYTEAEKGANVLTQMLLQEDADVNEPGDEYGNALQAASASTNCSDMLLDDTKSYAQDSGYATASKATTETLITQDLEDDDVATVVSTFTVNESDDYVSEIASNLFAKFAFDSFDSQTLERIYDGLHGQLKALALKLGHDTEDQEFRNIMVFIYSHESQIVERLKGLVYTAESQRSKFNRTHFTQDWLAGDATHDTTTDLEQHAKTSTIAQDSSHKLSCLPPDSSLSEHRNDDDAENVDSREVSTYGRLVFEEPAYTWFLACIERESTMDPASFNSAKAIRKEISDCFPSLRHVSRKRSAQSYKATFQIQWDPLAFIKDEGYKEDAKHVVETAITLTGSLTDAQALTCGRYLHQTWPVSGSHILQLIKSVVGSHRDQRHTCNLPDRTKITAWMTGSTLMVEAIGTICSVAEVGEQFAWIGSALRSSPYRSGVTCCTPRLAKVQDSREVAQRSETAIAGKARFDICFSVQSESDHLDSTSCRCWHKMFRNPVVVGGYPIPRRSEANTGLEIPLNMMAGLLNTAKADVFDGKVFIKSHSSMLVPTRQTGDLILWHFFQHEHGEPMLYHHNRGPHATINFSALEDSKVRHIVGWLSEAKILSGKFFNLSNINARDNMKWQGASEAAKCVDNSRLKGPSHGCALEHARIVKQIYIGHGATISYGVKDGRRESQNDSLESISRKYVILWDVESKRGWMMNGTTAFLHLLRASLELNRTGQLKYHCLFKQTHIKEAEMPDQCNSALQVLLDADNSSLPIFRDDSTRVKDRIEDFIYIFRTMFAWEENSYGKRPGPMTLRGETFECLEGWDFSDIATRKYPVIPRLEHVKTSGRSWIELSRSLEAVAIFGRGFGELIQPVDANRLCKYWERLPSEKYFLAAMVSDVQRMLEEVHNRPGEPRSLLAETLWHQSEKSAEYCRCSGYDLHKHADIVEILKPLNADGQPEEIYWIDKKNPGAVCFGSRGTDERHGDAADGAKSIVKSSHSVTRGQADELDCERTPPENQMAATSGRPFALKKSAKRKRSNLESLDAEDDAVTDSIRGSDNRIPPRRPDHLDEFQVSIICALTIEADVVQALFDGTWNDHDQPEDDINAYSTGWIGPHAVVLVHLAGMGKKQAATAAVHLKRTCKGIKLGLVVGICGGIPSGKIPEMVLGDVVVSTRVMQHDFGKQHETGFISKHTDEQEFHHSDGRIQSFENKVKTLLVQKRLRKRAISYMHELCCTEGPLAGKFEYPGLTKDNLYRRSYHHKHHDSTACASGKCFSGGLKKACFCEAASRTTCADLRCDTQMLITRTRIENARQRVKRYSKGKSRSQAKCGIPEGWSIKHPTITSSESWIHFGSIASGDTVMKSSNDRDRIAQQNSELHAFEMEGAGVWGTLPTVVVKGVCDYSDSHKNDDWHWYAAGTAAACTKALLYEWAVLRPHIAYRPCQKVRC